MNIVVVGGGTKGKFGYDFLQLSELEGHNCYNFSYRDTDVDKIVSKFKATIPEHIDIMVYNSNRGSYPFWAETDYQKNCKINLSAYYDTLKVHVAIPHALCLEAFQNMDNTSKIVFMTAGSSMQFDRDYNTSDCGYAGGKAWQNHLMLELAQNNNLGITISSISPHFEYGEKEYKNVFTKVYNHIIYHNKDVNGKIIKYGE